MTQAVAACMTEEQCLAGTGLTPSDLADEDAEIWAHQEFAVVRNIIGTIGDQGVEVGAASTFGRAGILGFTFLASATVREGLERIMPYLALSPSHVRLAVESDGEHAYVVADDTDIPADVRAFIVERDLSGIAAVLMGAGVLPEVDRLETTLDADRALRLVRSWSDTADVWPNQPRNRLVGRSAMLDLPLPQADPNTARIFERQCQLTLERRLARVGVTGQVRSRLYLDTGNAPSMQQVADELHLDPRTLRRKLADEGTSYRTLLDEVRRSVAERLLAEGQSIESIARNLGYAETASFTHAYTRWTGVAPSRARKP